ncbi:hypothetical protein [Streptomyces sp. NBC_01092]|uniref:hypothetical protein n=1 Tax=Streptomyces sp. NBC_01092 TaxID=2903748 RepID=UPI0038688637|nr:hypothetical protein OG254_24280 [Streptomyces sp. NBC_01092]
MTEPTVIALGDDRDTKYIVQTIPVDTGTCSHAHDSCGKPGVIAVRNTLDQQRPTESSTYRITMCAEHQGAAARMHELWVADARKLQDPDERAEFLAKAGITA